jgi:energy-coupling factor transporter ATP-binding protein EcfA2
MNSLSLSKTPGRADLRSRWMREFERLTQFKTQIYVYGNVKDTVLYPVGTENWKLGPLREALFEFFRAQGAYQIVAGYDLLDGMSFADETGVGFTPAPPLAKEPLVKESSVGKSAETPLTMAQLYEQLVDWSERKANENSKVGRHPRALHPEEPLDLALHQIRACLLNNKVPCAFVVEYSSQLVGAPNNLQQDERLSFLRLVKAATQSQRVGVRDAEGDGLREVQNILVLVCDKLTDLPPWLYLNNPFTGNVEIEAPRSYERRHFFERFLAHSPHLSELKALDDLVDMTDGMSVRDLFGIRKVARGDKLAIGARSGVKELVDRYKYGELESEWDNLAPERLIHAEEELARRVMGQSAAVGAVADVLRRARLHLSGAQHSSRSKPRGILFFAGPTGVGKTELAKAMAELVFGTEEACLRFDMSEYGQAQSDQRLMGAPPGYVGYEEGGQLTNRVKGNPFSVLLFDEIEKAHPSILDKFLQILEDGRMTDGRGDTVYFSESLIVFTSNVGIYQLDPVTNRPQIDIDGQPILNVDPREDVEYPVVRAKVLAGVEGYFKHILGRPELLNRIGQNIVVFDFVREETLRQIIEKKVLPSIAAQIEERWKVRVTFEEAVLDGLMELGGGDVSNGGRGIGNIAEAAILNPLARVLFGLFEAGNGQIAARNLTVSALIISPEAAHNRYEIEWQLKDGATPL